MAGSTTFVIIGGGLAGAKAVEALRAGYFDGQIILFCEEKQLPYERPPLSEEYLAGKKSLVDFTVQNADWYRDKRVDLRLDARVSSLDAAGHTVGLPDGTIVAYDKLLLATGSASRRPPIPGSDADGVHYLRTYDDAVSLNSVLAEGSSLAVVGAGWIGLEAGLAGARQRGVDVTVVETAKAAVGGRTWGIRRRSFCQSASRARCGPAAAGAGRRDHPGLPAPMAAPPVCGCATG